MPRNMSRYTGSCVNAMTRPPRRAPSTVRVWSLNGQACPECCVRLFEQRNVASSQDRSNEAPGPQVRTGGELYSESNGSEAGPHRQKEHAPGARLQRLNVTARRKTAGPHRANVFRIQQVHHVELR